MKAVGQKVSFLVLFFLVLNLAFAKPTLSAPEAPFCSKSLELMARFFKKNRWKIAIPAGIMIAGGIHFYRSPEPIDREAWSIALEDAAVVTEEDQALLAKKLSPVSEGPTVKINFISQTHSHPLRSDEFLSWSDADKFEKGRGDLLIQEQLKIFKYLKSLPKKFIFIFVEGFEEGGLFVPADLDERYQEDFKRVFPNGIPIDIHRFSNEQKLLFYKLGAPTAFAIETKRAALLGTENQDIYKRALEELQRNHPDFSYALEQRETSALYAIVHHLETLDLPENIRPDEVILIFGGEHQFQDYRHPRLEIKRTNLPD